MYKVVFDKEVFKFLENHKWEKIIIQFKQAVEVLKFNPFNNNLDIDTYKERRFAYRLRLWKYRFIYEIIKDELIIRFVDAWSRWDIYK
jgi:mRNA interferase RelE/StbE